MSIFQKGTKLSCMFLVMLCFAQADNFVAQEGSRSDPRRPLSPENKVNASLPNLPYFSPKEPVSCEIAGVYVDDAAARTMNAENTYLIVIARLGYGERSRQLNHRRLDEVKRYIRRHPSVRLTAAEGERVQGYGRLEFYVGGKLLYAMPIRRTTTFNLSGCIFV